MANQKNKEEKLSEILDEIYEELGLDTPWEGDFDEFMSNPDNALDFDK